MNITDRVKRLERSGDCPTTETELDAAIIAAWTSELEAARESGAYQRDFEALLDAMPNGRQAIEDDPIAWLAPLLQLYEREHGPKILKGNTWIYREDYRRIREKLLREQGDRLPGIGRR